VVLSANQEKNCVTLAGYGLARGQITSRVLMALIAPALLAADFARLGEALRTVEAAGCRMIHIDVADGHFTGDVTVGQPVVESIRKATRLELDLHLLIERPERYVQEFVHAGANRLAVHPESTPHLYRTLKVIRRSGARAGVALGPGIPLDSLSDVLRDFDFLNILTADPDHGPGLASSEAEPELIRTQLDKVGQAFKLRERLGLSFELQVDGGLKRENIEDVISIGADILVCGFDIFHSQDPLARLTDLTRAASRFKNAYGGESRLSTGGTPANS
jgi:ribulose-phosphate 3-epimerase